MRTATLLLAVLAVTASIGPVTAASDPAVRIAEVHPRPASDGREFIELWNPGNGSVDLTGWDLTDGTNTYTFTDQTLHPGDRMVVWGGGDQSTLGPTWKANVWNNGGDTVTLLDADGALVDTMQYGTTEVPAPDEGVSLHWDGAWVDGDPTPGQDMQASDGSATATVEDLPPEVTWDQAPGTARPGENVSVTFSIDDPNGDALQWSVEAGDTAIATGAAAGTHTLTAKAPEMAGTWTWVVTASSTDHQTEATWDMEITTGPFSIDLPDEGIHFPALSPGATEVTASASFTITHHGTDAAVPYLDVSPFQGAGATIPVDGNLRLHLTDASNTTTVVDYDGPLHPLPSMQPGDQVDVTLVILQVPTPLHAGDYRSSFSVVA